MQNQDDMYFVHGKQDMKIDLNPRIPHPAGKKWHERRKIITPAFHFKILEQFVEVFDRLGNTVVTKTLQKYDREDEFEMYPIAVLYALDVMCGKFQIKYFTIPLFDCRVLNMCDINVLHTLNRVSAGHSTS